MSERNCMKVSERNRNGKILDRNGQYNRSHVKVAFDEKVGNKKKKRIEIDYGNTNTIRIG